MGEGHSGEGQHYIFRWTWENPPTKFRPKACCVTAIRPRFFFTLKFVIISRCQILLNCFRVFFPSFYVLTSQIPPRGRSNLGTDLVSIFFSRFLVILVIDQMGTEDIKWQSHCGFPDTLVDENQSRTKHLDRMGSPH